MKGRRGQLAIIPAGIDTYRQPVVYMHEDCDLCRAEGFSSLARVEILHGQRSLIATLNVVTEGNWLPRDCAALSDWAWKVLGAKPGDLASFRHPEPAISASAIRAKVYGRRLSPEDIRAVVEDIVHHRLSDLDLAAFVAACAGDKLDVDETIALTRAMTETGRRLEWNAPLVLDKHCVGGLPGNRTTPIVVAIVAAAGHVIPKTSSRAITSPAGTADTMEVMAPVNLDAARMRAVVEAEGGCVVWGGALDLAPADDILIRIERPLDFDSEGQMVASILSKKAAAGSTHVLVDMPVGPTAKVRSPQAAQLLADRLVTVGEALGLTLRIHRSDGSAPVGRGIGPSLEASDVLEVLRRDERACQDLRERALALAGNLLDMAAGRTVEAGEGRALATEILDSGKAEAKFLAICEAQGGFSEPSRAPHRHLAQAPCDGVIAAIDNRRIARIAKLAGAPNRKRAGVLLRARPGERVRRGEGLYEIHAETPGELEWACDYAARFAHPFLIEEAGG